MDSASIVSQLRRKETHPCVPGTALHQVRKLYQTIVPNKWIGCLQPYLGHCIQAFSPCGMYLVAFGPDLTTVVIFRYKGIPCLDKFGEDDRRLLSFDEVFDKIHEVNCRPEHDESTMLDNVVIFCHASYLIVASSSQDARFIEPEGQWLGVEEVVTFHSIHLETGQVMDRVVVSAEGLDLSIPNVVSTYGHKVVVLSPRTLILFEIDKEGAFSKPFLLGKFCSPEDEDIVTACYRWTEEQESGNPQSRVQRNTTLLLDGLKQRMLAYLYNKAIENTKIKGGQNEYCGDSTPVKSRKLGDADSLSTFYYYFEILERLELNHAQFLDDSRLLLSWGKSNIEEYRSMPRGLRTIYNLETTKFEKIFPTEDPEFFEWCIKNPNISCMGAPTSVWENFALDSLMGQKAWQQTAEMLRDIPPLTSCHHRQLSPYVDRELFQYDEKSIQRDLLAVYASRYRSGKFVARSLPDRLRFVLKLEDCMGGPTQEGTNEYENEEIRGRYRLLHLFHPVEPTVFCIVSKNGDYSGQAEFINVFTYVS